MPRTSDDTRQRIFAAATAEFASHGIAGARVDRIAAAAGANKQLIYAYFGSKDELFEAVASEHLGRFVAEVPFDPADLPSHAVALHDFYTAHPDVAQLRMWHSLAFGETTAPIPAVEKAVRARAREVARAQAAGVVNPSIRASDLLIQLAAIASAFALPTPEAVPSRSASARREAVREAVERLVRP